MPLFLGVEFFIVTGGQLFVLLMLTKAALLTLAIADNYAHLARDVQFMIVCPPGLSSLLEPAHGYLLGLFGTTTNASELDREHYTLLGYRVVYGALPFVYLTLSVTAMLWVRRRVRSLAKHRFLPEHQISATVLR